MYASMLSYPGSLLGQFDRLQRELDDIFTRGLPASIRSVAPGSFPAINVAGTPQSIEVLAFAPGIDAASVEVTFDRGVLTISGQRASDLPDPQATPDKKARIYAHERFNGRFQRTVSLPEDVDPAQIQAQYRDGVLRVTIARRAQETPKRITIQ